jgi:transposase
MLSPTVCRFRPPAERVAAHRERANPILDELRALLDPALVNISGKSDFAKVIRYSTSRWTALARYVDDRRLKMTNNAAERAVRPLTLGRKNYLFAGSDEGGRRAGSDFPFKRVVLRRAAGESIRPKGRGRSSCRQSH